MFSIKCIVNIEISSKKQIKKIKIVILLTEIVLLKCFSFIKVVFLFGFF